MDEVKSTSRLLVVRGERVIKELGPGSGFPKDSDGSLVSEEQFQEFLGLLVRQGIPWFGITTGFTPNEVRGERLVLLTNEDEIEKERAQRASQQTAEDFVCGSRDLIESGDITFSD